MMTPIVIAFTPNYFIPAAVTLQSMFASSTGRGLFEVICLLSEDLPKWQVKEMENLGKGRAIYKFINLKGSLGDVYIDPRYSEAASYRLLLPDLLPDYDKILYIDCDVVVRQDLQALYESIELGDNYLAGVFEATLDHQIPHMAAIGCVAGHYINSGFLVMNLELMRKKDMVRKFLDGLKVEYLEFPDQDVLNTVCNGHILGLSPVYNGIRTFFLPQYKEVFLRYYTEEEWCNVQNSATIHYTGGKPWDIFSVKFGEWWEEYIKLPGSIRDRMAVNGKLLFFYRLYRIRPIGCMIDTFKNLYRKTKYMFGPCFI